MASKPAEKEDIYAPPKADPVSLNKAPKGTLLVVVKAGIAKSVLLWWQTIALAWSAGIFIAIGAACVFSIAGAVDSFHLTGTIPVFDGTSTVDASLDWNIAIPVGVRKLLAGVLFPVGLMLIVLSGAELFTGNIMFLLAARMAGKCTWPQVIRNWILSYFGNLCGCLAVAYFMFHATEMYEPSPYSNFVMATAHAKTSHGNFGKFFLKGVGCNFLVCTSLWCQLACDDVISKIVSIWWPIMAFVCIGFEHSIANMFFLPLAMMDGFDLSTNEFLRLNLVPVTIGNIVGGSLFIFVQYLIYHPYVAVEVSTMRLKQGNKKAGAQFKWHDGLHHAPGHEHSMFAGLHSLINSLLGIPNEDSTQEETDQSPTGESDQNPTELDAEETDKNYRPLEVVQEKC